MLTFYLTGAFQGKPQPTIWIIGEYISKKIEQSEWGDSVVTELANFIQTHEPDIKGFSDKNIWRMKQFYETYKDFPKLSPLVREISWTNNLLIFSRCKSIEEMEFYLKYRTSYCEILFSPDHIDPCVRYKIAPTFSGQQNLRYLNFQHFKHFPCDPLI